MKNLQTIEKATMELRKKLAKLPDQIEGAKIKQLENALGVALLTGRDVKAARVNLSQAKQHNSEIPLMRPCLGEVNSRINTRLNGLAKLRALILRKDQLQCEFANQHIHQADKLNAEQVFAHELAELEERIAYISQEVNL